MAPCKVSHYSSAEPLTPSLATVISSYAEALLGYATTHPGLTRSSGGSRRNAPPEECEYKPRKDYAHGL